MTVTRILYPERPAGGRLGRIVEHDERSRAYAYKGRRSDAKTVLHTRYVPILDQGDVGMCTGCAATAALGTDPLFTAAREPQGLSARYALAVYSDATRIDEFAGGYPPDDTGSSGLAVAKVLHRRGLIGGYAHIFDAQEAVSAASKGPLITGISWWSSFDEPADDGTISISSTATLSGGHEVAIVGVDVDRKAFYCANSWGSAWGRRGYFWMPFALFADLMADSGDATVLRPAPRIPIPSSPHEALAATFRAGDWVSRPHVGQNAAVARGAATWLSQMSL